MEPSTSVDGSMADNGKAQTMTGTAMSPIPILRVSISLLTNVRHL